MEMNVVEKDVSKRLMDIIKSACNGYRPYGKYHPAIASTYKFVNIAINAG